jgi:hypothetical protein
MPTLIQALSMGLAILIAGCASPYPPAEPPVAVVAAPSLQAGDTWVYAQINAYNGLVERTLTDTLKRAGAGFVVERRSDRPADPLHTETIAAPWRETGEAEGNMRRSFSAPLARIPFPIAPGQSWREQSSVTDAHGVTYLWRSWGGARGWERIRTPAGEFAALRVERVMNLGDYDYSWSDTEVIETYWYAPAVKRWVRLEHQYERVELGVSPRIRRKLTDRIVWELREFRPGPG